MPLSEPRQLPVPEHSGDRKACSRPRAQGRQEDLLGAEQILFHLSQRILMHVCLETQHCKIELVR